MDTCLVAYVLSINREKNVNIMDDRFLKLCVSCLTFFHIHVCAHLLFFTVLCIAICSLHRRVFCVAELFHSSMR